MWVMTTDGFYSAVEYHHNKDKVYIRARSYEDIDMLRNALQRLSDMPVTVLRDDDADYRYRVCVSKKMWADYLANAAIDIDYTNFKDRISEIDYARALLYGDVWSVLYKIQLQERPDGRYH